MSSQDNPRKEKQSNSSRRQKKKSSNQNGTVPQSPFKSTVQAPVALNTQFQFKRPVISNVRNGIRVTHTERFATVVSGTNFAVTSYSINPGNIYMFPWMCNVAARFESYVFKRLEFEYKTKTATSATGDVTLAVDYDSADSDPSTTIQLENWEDTVNTAPWQDATFVCSQHNLVKEQRERYVRRYPLAANLDIKTYDVGRLHVATEGQAGVGTRVGYLYAKYEIELLTPQLEFDDMALGGKILGAGVFTAGNPLGDTAAVDGQSLGIAVSASSVVTLHFPGTYVFSYLIGGTVITAVSPTLSTGVGSITSAGVVNAAGTFYTGYLVVQSQVLDGAVTFAATATTVTSAVVFVSSNPLGSNA